MYVNKHFTCQVSSCFNLLNVSFESLIKISTHFNSIPESRIISKIKKDLFFLDRLFAHVHERVLHIFVICKTKAHLGYRIY